MGQEEASEPTYTTHVKGLALHEPSTTTVPLFSSGVLPDGRPIHDILLTDHINDGILPAVTDLDINVSDAKSGILPEGLSVHDTLLTDHINDGILQAVTDLGINVSDAKTGILPEGLSVHDSLPADQIYDGILQAVTDLDINVSDAKTATLPDGLVHGTLLTDHINEGIQQALTTLDSNVSDSKISVVPEGLSVHDTLLTDHFTHGILPASGHLDISDSKHLLTGNQAALLKADMAEAATEWLNHIANPGHTPINVLLNITDDDKTHPRFDGAPAFLMSTGSDANDTWESAFAYKLQNGADPTTGLESFPKLSDGAQADVVININSNYLNSVGWLDPNPGEGTDPVPADKVDMVSELMHEFGHGLGIGATKSLDITTGTFDAGQKTTWESLLDVEKSGTYFTGSHAIREHGGPVVVTTNTPEENYGHLGNALSDATDPKTGGPDVMFGVYFETGKRYEVSDLDVAILQDLGYHIKNPYEINVSEVARPTWLDIHSLVSTQPEAIATRGDHATDISTFLDESAGLSHSFWDQAATAIDAVNHTTNLPTQVGESGGLSHGFWDQAAGASGISNLLSSNPIQGLGTETVAYQSSLDVTQIADLLSHLSSSAHSDISAVTAAQVVAPTFLADEQIAHLQFDTAYLAEFAHQLI
jgi:hypothetical protein